jgi:hypothetical protein
MRKIRTENDLYDALISEVSWRRKELINLNNLHRSARGHHAEMLRRAGIVLLYAHWEGFVRKAGAVYLEYVARQKLVFKELQSNFIALGIRGDLRQAVESNKSEMMIKVIDFMLTSMDNRAQWQWDDVVQTKSNLSAERFREICNILALDYREFEVREKSVIQFLLEQRNNIAHGQFLSVTADDYIRLHEEMMFLLTHFVDLINNAAVQKSFKRAVRN